LVRTQALYWRGSSAEEVPVQVASATTLRPKHQRGPSSIISGYVLESTSINSHNLRAALT
ncbi:hypothetical protein NPIL_104521, partial [Nephila pilipes]